MSPYITVCNYSGTYTDVMEQNVSRTHLIYCMKNHRHAVKKNSSVLNSKGLVTLIEPD